MTVSPFGRPIVFGGARECPHSRRVLGGYVFAHGARHVCDWCLACGGRSECIARADLAAAGIDWSTIPPMRDNRGLAA